MELAHNRPHLERETAIALAGWDVRLDQRTDPVSIRASYRCRCGGYLEVDVRGFTLRPLEEDRAGSGPGLFRTGDIASGTEIKFTTRDLRANDEALEAGRRLGRHLLTETLTFVIPPACQGSADEKRLVRGFASARYRA